MADKYKNYKALALSEKESLDYSIYSANRDSEVLIFAPHGGSIEPGSSELAKEIAGDDLSFYLFEGIKPKGNATLHITSTNFDEPKLESLLKLSNRSIALHGEASMGKQVFLGGLDQFLRPHIEYCLNEANFETAMHQNPLLQGTSKSNVCNRCKLGEGLQLELSKGLRMSFFKSLQSEGRNYKTEEFLRFVSAVRKGIRYAYSE